MIALGDYGGTVLSLAGAFLPVLFYVEFNAVFRRYVLIARIVALVPGICKPNDYLAIMFDRD